MPIPVGAKLLDQPAGSSALRVAAPDYREDVLGRRLHGHDYDAPRRYRLRVLLLESLERVGDRQRGEQGHADPHHARLPPRP
jgi:hypothetical protein